MNIKQSISSIMVPISTFAFMGAFVAPVFGQVVITCSTGLALGKNVQCSDTASFRINPDGSTDLLTGCVVPTAPVQAGQCFVKTGGVAPTNNVRVDFADAFVNINNGANILRIDDFRMQYTATVPAASHFTFTPTDVSNTVTLNVGGTVEVSPSQAIGTYTGGIVIRANEL